MHRRIWFFLTVAILTACGGSGGGSPTLTASAVLTTQNASTVAGAVTDAVLGSGDLSEIAEFSLLGTAGVAPVMMAATVAAGELAKEAAQLQAEKAEVSISLSEACPSGGSLNISANIANEQTLTAGDSFSVNYNNCDFGDGLLLNGGMDMRVLSFQGDLNVGQIDNLGFDININSFSLMDLGETMTLSGDLAMTLDSTATSVTATVSSSSLNLTTSLGESFSLAQFTTTTVVDLTTFPESVSLQSDGFLMGSDFTGQIQFSTTVEFNFTGEGDPSAGELLITGADGATIRVIAVDSLTVRLELDLDGIDGVDPDGVIVTTWQQLLNTPA
jgi:hypothetical protein